jgi:CelD/BcsL family acetyltransferase involved in cellulose biosynthesis
LSEFPADAAILLPPVGERPDSSVVERVNPLEDSGWDALLTRHPSASFFHGAAWAKVLQNTYGYTPLYFVLRESGRLRALLPMMEVDSWLTGRRGISLPFTDDCEPLCADTPSFRKVFQEAMRTAEARDWKYVECRGGKRFFDDAPSSTAFHGHRLRLTGSEEVLFANVESSVRRAIRKAEKSGVRVEFSQSLDAVQVFYDLQCKTRKKHGLPPQPFRFFENIYAHVLTQNHGVVALARYEQRPVAACVYFHAGKKAIYKYGASDETFQQVRANNLVMWEAIQWYAHHGFEELDFGRTSLANEGLRRFKLGWGTAEHKIEYVRYDRRERAFVTVKDEASGWHNRVFRALPGFVSRRIGALLYKHVA